MNEGKSECCIQKKEFFFFFAGKIYFLIQVAIFMNGNKMNKKLVEEEITTKRITLAVVRQNGEVFFGGVEREERKERRSVVPNSYYVPSFWSMPTMIPGCLGRPTMDGKTARGASSPAKPALHIPDPLSTTRAWTSSSSSHIFIYLFSFCLDIIKIFLLFLTKTCGQENS